MNLIAKLLPAQNVVLDLDVSSKKRVFEHAGLLFENNQNVARSQVFDSLFAREKLGSTGLGQGIAIPHGRIKGLKEAVGAMIRMREPIPFDAPDGQPVNLIFVLLVPERATDLRTRANVQRSGIPRATVESRIRPSHAPGDRRVATACRKSA